MALRAARAILTTGAILLLGATAEAQQAPAGDRPDNFPKPIELVQTPATAYRARLSDSDTASLKTALDAARNAALLATQRYASGVIDFQTVLETQRTLLNVQDSVASAETELASAHVRLYKALGGGWQPAAPETRS